MIQSWCSGFKATMHRSNNSVCHWHKTLAQKLFSSENFPVFPHIFSKLWCSSRALGVSGSVHLWMSALNLRHLTRCRRLIVDNKSTILWRGWVNINNELVNRFNVRNNSQNSWIYSQNIILPDSSWASRHWIKHQFSSKFKY